MTDTFFLREDYNSNETQPPYLRRSEAAIQNHFDLSDRILMLPTPRSRSFSGGQLFSVLEIGFRRPKAWQFGRSVFSDKINTCGFCGVEGLFRSLFSYAFTLTSTSTITRWTRDFCRITSSTLPCPLEPIPGHCSGAAVSRIVRMWQTRWGGTGSTKPLNYCSGDLFVSTDRDLLVTRSQMRRETSTQWTCVFNFQPSRNTLSVVSVFAWFQRRDFFVDCLQAHRTDNFILVLKYVSKERETQGHGLTIITARL